MKTTSHDEAQMSRLVECARYLLQEAEQVATGKAVKITLYGGARGKMSDVLPLRVAAYMLSVMGETQLFNEEQVAVEFANKGESTDLLFITPQGHIRLLHAWVAWQVSERRRLQRALARAKKDEKGGQTGE